METVTAFGRVARDSRNRLIHAVFSEISVCISSVSKISVSSSSSFLINSNTLTSKFVRISFLHANCSQRSVRQAILACEEHSACQEHSSSCANVSITFVMIFVGCVRYLRRDLQRRLSSSMYYNPSWSQHHQMWGTALGIVRFASRLCGYERMQDSNMLLLKLIHNNSKYCLLLRHVTINS